MVKKWSKTALAAAGSRTDDIFFLDDNSGWAVNSDGKVYLTQDGGATWDEKAFFADAYLRCISFSTPSIGWIGTLSGPHRMYSTIDGGETWKPVVNLPLDGPQKICGLCAVSDDVIFASGTNYPNEAAGVLRSTDGGGNWEFLDMDGQPTILVDILFEDAQIGWVVGAVDEVAHPGRDPVRRDVVPAVFFTDDGGATWTNQVELNASIGEFPRGEWGWKIQKLGISTLFVSCENFLDGAVLRSDDNGASWTRLRINDRQRNSNLEGVGFVDPDTGWVGGWGDLFFGGGFTSSTSDGGKTWNDANEVGFRLNRFRMLGNPVRVAYASGDTVYKYSDTELPQPADGLAAVVQARASGMQEVSGEDQVGFDIDVPVGTGRLTVRIWERYGREVRVLVDEETPKSGVRRVTWDFVGNAGARVPYENYVVRTVMDGESQSRIVRRKPD